MKKVDKKVNKKIRRINFLVIIILIFLILDLHFYGGFGRTTFMRDWTYVFEGGYRISSGQLPFQDFYIPMGPVVFLMQGFFNLIFGANVLSMLLHSFLLSIILSVIFYYLARKEFGIFISFIFSLFLYISFQGLAFHPSYNYSTYFFLLLNIFLIYYYSNKESLPKYVYLLSALLGTLDFYTKQDTGALHLFLLLIYFSFNYKKDWKKILLFYLIPSVIFMAGTFLSLSLLEGFPYWYNLGQLPHNPNFSKFFSPVKIVMITTSWHFYLGILFVYLILFTKIEPYKKRIMSLFVILAISNIISNTLSGSTRQLSVISFPIMIFFLYILTKDFFKNSLKKYKIPLIYLLIFILFLNSNPIPTYGLITLNYLNPEISRIQEGCATGVPMYRGHLEGLQEIRDIIKINPDFVSLTEYSFLYCDYGIEPPKEVPMTYREGIHFYMQDFEKIINTIVSNNPDIILVQNTHGHDISIHQKTIDELILKGYKNIKVIEKTATPNAPITILKKVN